MKQIKLYLVAVMTAVTIISCGDSAQHSEDSVAEASVDSKEEFYKKTKSQVDSEDMSEYEQGDVTNEAYDPNSPEAALPLIGEGRTYELDSNIEVKFDARTTEELAGEDPKDTIRIGGETFVRDFHNITKNDLYNLRHNLEDLKSTRENSSTDGQCRGEECPVYAHINKKEQRLYLYINGNPVDTFKTSTARSGYKTPDFNRKPDGRIYTKYSSHKYHGGNWNGLGNMPYAVFVEGGYAIHGATSGEIHQLGQPASHGCIRIHPKNAKVFNKLVKFAGVENTWVKVTEN